MTSEQFIKLACDMGVANKKVAEAYVKAKKKDNYDDYNDIRDISRFKEANERHNHLHGFKHYGRYSGLRQEELSCTGNSGEWEADMSKENMFEWQIRRGYRDPITGKKKARYGKPVVLVQNKDGEWVEDKQNEVQE